MARKGGRYIKEKGKTPKRVAGTEPAPPAQPAKAPAANNPAAKPAIKDDPS